MGRSSVSWMRGRIVGFARAFGLDRGVADAEPLAEHGLHRPPHRIRILAGAEGDVDRAADVVAAERPDVQVVQGRHPRRFANGLADVGQGDAAGHALEQDMGGVAQQDPGAGQHPQGDGDRHHGVDPGPAGDADGYGPGDDPDRADHVGPDLEVGALEVEAGVLDLLTQQMIGQDTSLAIAINSGARGNISQLNHAVGMLGVLSDASSSAIELPIKSGYVKGLEPLEYFTGTRGTRKALIDIALKTADAGYLTRRLVDVAQDVFTLDGEGEDPGFTMLRSDAAEIGVNYGSRLAGRYAAEDVAGYVKRGEAFSQEIAAKIDADDKIDGVKIMSVLSSSSVRGVPQKCYGFDPASGGLVTGHHPIGVIAAQSIGEPGTQLSLDSKHRSGAVLADDTAQGLSRVEELFEVRTPKGQAYLTEVAGIANVWEEGDHYVVQVTASDKDNVTLELGDRTIMVASGSDVAQGDVIASDPNGANPLVAPTAGKLDITNKTATISPSSRSVVRYEIPGFKQMFVKDGDVVEAGQRLTNGSINLHDLLRLQGVEPTQRYIMNEILRIFAGQGQNIADKHLEIIVRQMFSRVQIEDAGDSEFVTGDVVSKLAVVENNEKLATEKKQLIQYNQLLLGITKASLSTDSFLSAASFQDTTRVLIAAATSGKIDQLYGLKENVILGRKIPVGTGYRTPEEVLEAAAAANALDIAPTA